MRNFEVQIIRLILSGACTEREVARRVIISQRLELSGDGLHQRVLISTREFRLTIAEQRSTIEIDSIDN